jgi:spoIIIJ-associated protein
MNNQREFEGKDLEDVLQAASASLGIAEPDLDYEIVEQGRRGLFGLGAKSVRIRVMPPVGESLKEGPARRRRSHGDRRKRKESKPATPPSSPDADDVRITIQKMLDLMGLKITAHAQQADSGLNVHLEGPDRKMLTQKDGELISALQFLLNRMAHRAWPEAGRIHLSCNGQRKRRDEDLAGLAREVAQQVSATGKAKRLHPMNAYERRLVHIAVRGFTELGSRSEGNGYLKRVRIYKISNKLD